MKTTRRDFLSLTPLAVREITAKSPGRAAPAAYGVVPSEPQVEWSEMEFYNFLHFTVNTFTDKEWGYGDEDPAIFKPTAFDADAIVETLKEAGSSRRDTYLQASRRVLFMAHQDHRALHS